MRGCAVKKIAFWNRYPELNPILFTDRNAPIGDDLLLPFQRLRQAATQRGVECVVFQGEEDPAWWEEVVGFVFIDRPARGVYSDPPTVPRARALPCPAYLIAFENETILPSNWENLGGFAKVMSFARAVTLPADRYVHLFPATDFDEWLPGVPLDRRRFCTMIASNKWSGHPRSIYRLRGQVLDAFALHEGFDLYGHGWSASPWYQGPLPPGAKRSTMTRYRFALVMENAQIPDYVTEKMFDAFIAGTVPVYWGAPNIAEWVDPEAYLDASRFTGPHEILRRLATMTDDEWDSHRAAGLRWMLSPNSRPFSIQTFTKTILDTVLG